MQLIGARDSIGCIQPQLMFPAVPLNAVSFLQSKNLLAAAACCHPNQVTDEGRTATLAHSLSLSRPLGSACQATMAEQVQMEESQEAERRSIRVCLHGLSSYSHHNPIMEAALQETNSV